MAAVPGPSCIREKRPSSAIGLQFITKHQENQFVFEPPCLRPTHASGSCTGGGTCDTQLRGNTQTTNWVDMDVCDTAATSSHARLGCQTGRSAAWTAIVGLLTVHTRRCGVWSTSRVRGCRDADPNQHAGMDM